mmetsp:Transcript_15630/g.46878  ORF Transcript_15630/g.46878 Transcript_15630/m.46878 type:complete len:580 (-) Transcript_15630:27-1766(-)
MQPSAGRPVSRQMIGNRSSLTSSMGTTAAQGIALGTTVNVSDRPVTQQGMRGMKTVHGPTRQVQDSSYYVGILRGKIMELTNEIHSLQAESKQHERSMHEYGGLQRRHENLLGEVRTLEGTLADYNLAMDKGRVGTDPAELSGYVAEFQAKNKQFASEVDRIFLIKKQKDDDASQIDVQIQELHQLAQQKINNLEPEKVQRYDHLLDQSLDLQKKQDAMLAEIDNLVVQIRELEGPNHKQSHSDEYAQLTKRGERLQKHERRLSDELAIWESADPKEALRRLKCQVETQSSELKHHEEYVRDTKSQIILAERQLSELHEEIKDRKSESGGERQKYDKLRQRDEDMSRFISEYEGTRMSTLQDQQQAQCAITSLLEHISRTLEEQCSIPTQQRLLEMRDEATFKERQLESSQETTSRLNMERKQRETELLKIETLDEKIQAELTSLQQRMDLMRSDMIEFDNVDGLRHRASATMSTLSRLLKEYQGRRESVKSQVTHLTTKYEGLKTKIQNSESAKPLSTLEAKIRTYGQTIFHLQEFVEVKNRETDYRTLKESASNLIGSLNMHTKTIASLGRGQSTHK